MGLNYSFKILCFLFIIIFLLVFSVGCNNSNSNSKDKKYLNQKKELLEKLYGESSLKLNNSVDLLYHNIDEERLIGLEEWLILANAAFELTEVIPSKASLITLHTYDSYTDIMSVRLAPNEIKGEPTLAVQATWSYNNNSFELKQLKTTIGSYLLITKLPAN